MLTVDKKKKYTAEDYLLLEEGAPFELINYDLIMSPSPSALHQLISGKIYLAISLFLEKSLNDGIIMYSPIDVHLDSGNVLQPDLVYIAEERKEIVQTFVEGPPDLVVEILSPSNAYYDLRQKKDIYEKYGVTEYIIIDPVQENADLYALKDGLYYLHQKANKTEILNSIVLPGFGIELSKFFK